MSYNIIYQKTKIRHYNLLVPTSYELQSLRCNNLKETNLGLEFCRPARDSNKIIYKFL